MSCPLDCSALLPGIESVGEGSSQALSRSIVYAVCRSCLCILFAIGCGAAWADEKPKPKQTEYERFIQPYTAKAKAGFFPGPKAPFDFVPVPLKLIVTAIVDDDPQTQKLHFSRETSFGCDVSIDGQVDHFSHQPFANKGGGYWTIPEAERKRLDTLLSKLPDDGARLPPFDRRVVLQMPEGDHSRVRVYDRANAPDEVSEILRLSLSGIRSWVLEIKSENDLIVGGHSINGLFALTPNSQLITAVSHGSLKFWDPVTHKELSDLHWREQLLPSGIKFSPIRIQEVAFSPDQSMVAVATGQDDYGMINCIRVWKMVTGELVHRLRPFEKNACENVVGLHWTADSQYVLAAINIDTTDNCGINVWNAKSGRQRGNLIEGLFHPTGVVILPDARHIAAGGEFFCRLAVRSP
jgi:hypothetical protein